MEEKTNEISPNVRPLPTYLVDRDHYAAGGTAPDYAFEQERPLQDYLRIFLTYRWLIVTVTFVALACSLLYSFLATPLYTAQAKLKIGTYSPLLPQANIEDILRQQTREQDYLQTQIELLSSLTLADKVLSQSGIDNQLKLYFARKTGFFSVFKSFFSFLAKEKKKTVSPGSSYHYPISTLQSYLALVSIQPVRKTSLVNVSVTTADPELSARIANTHSQAFIELVRAERQESAVENLVFLKAQAEELSNKVALSEKNLAAYAEENAIVSLNKDENIVVKRMSELSQLLTDATAKRIRSESAYKEAESGSGFASTSHDDDAIHKLRTTLKENEAEYAMLSQKFTPEYPRMVQLKAQIDMLTKNLNEQRGQVVRGLKADYESDLGAENELKNELEMQKSKAFELSRREVQYNIMKREYESLKDLHQSVLRQLKEAQISAESRGSNIALSDHAAVPITHSYPRRMLNTLAALIFGPLLAFVLAFTLEALDNTLKTPDEVQAVLQLPALGIVPAFNLEDHALSEEKADAASGEERVDTAEAGETDAALPVMVTATVPVSRDFVTLNAPRSIASESFRAIRTGILLSAADNRPRIILVTSAKKSEGKTTLISNLAITLAQSGSETLVVDADLRRPNINRQFGLDPQLPGLVDCLTGQKPLDGCIHRATIPHLAILPSGPKPPNPAELIGSRKMAELLEELAGKYEYVLLDTPPVLPVTDAVILSRLVDGVVLIVRGNDTQKQVARDSVARLRQVGSRILGVVLNDVNVKSGQYYYYYRDTYADYYAEDSGKKGRRKKGATG